MSITNPHGVPTASVPEIPGTRFDADVLANLELAGFPHWVCWTYELRDGERTKPLLNATTGRYAKSNDPSTWTTFDSAVGRGLREGWGVGFVFHATLNPFAGVDLDKCRCPDTAVLSPWAQSMVRAFNSYVEVSPSATGVKLVVRGKPKHNGRKAGTDGSAVETYGTGRYFTLTGWALARSTIGDGQRMLDRLCDRLWPPPPPPPPRPAGRLHLVTMSDATVLDRARRARNGALFAALWNGEWQSRYGSQSEADLALCSLLAFWCDGNAERVNALFRQSGLYRAKWDRADYRHWTLERACGGRA